MKKLSGIYRSGMTVTEPTLISGVIRGNLDIRAHSTISGTVHGNVHASADLRISGTISGTVVADGCTVYASGVLTGSRVCVNGGSFEGSGVFSQPVREMKSEVTGRAPTAVDPISSRVNLYEHGSDLTERVGGRSYHTAYWADGSKIATWIDFDKLRPLARRAAISNTYAT